MEEHLSSVWQFDIWTRILPVLILLSLIATTSGIFLVLWLVRGREVMTYKDETHREGSAWLSPFFRNYWHWLTEPLFQFLLKRGFTPNKVTFLAVGVSALTGLVYSFGYFHYAGWLVILAGTLDIIDGKIARATDSVTRSGAYLDSTLDRLSDGLIFMGLAAYFAELGGFYGWLVAALSIFALIGSVLVSYSKARGENMGVKCEVGLMQRPERVYTIGICSLLDPIFGFIFSDYAPFHWHVMAALAITVVAVLSLYTSYQRMRYVFDELELVDAPARENGGNGLDVEAGGAAGGSAEESAPESAS